MTSISDLGVDRQRTTPFSSVGAPGTAIWGGFIQEDEKDTSLKGLQKYVTYSDILANTSIVAGSVRFFLNLVAKAQWTVEPADDSAEAERLAELVDDMIGDMTTPWRRVVRRAAMFKFYGFGLQEWTAKRREDGAIGFLDIEPRAQKTIERWDVDESGTVLGVVQRSPQTMREIWLPRGKLVYMVDDSLNDSPEGLGIFRHLAQTAKRQDKLQLLEGWGFETDLRGIPIARAPLTQLALMVENGELTQDQADALRAPLESFAETHIKGPELGLLLDSMTYETSDDKHAPSNVRQFDVELLKGGNTSQEAVAAAITRMDKELARVIGTEFLMLGSDGSGSLALSKEKTHVFRESVSSTLSEMGDTFDADLIGPLWALNGWSDGLRPKLKPGQVQNKDIEEVTTALRDMATAGAPLQVNDPVINATRDLLGVPHAPEIDTDMDEALLGAAQPGQEPEQDDVEDTEEDSTDE
jgi:hypothetical protein